MSSLARLDKLIYAVDSQKPPSVFEARRVVHKIKYQHMAAVYQAPLIIPLWAASRLSKQVQNVINRIENKIGKRPCLKAAATVEMAFGWTPDPASEIVALSLAACSLSTYCMEKTFGKAKVEAALSLLQTPFHLAARQINPETRSAIKEYAGILADKGNTLHQRIKTTFENHPTSQFLGLKF